MVSLVRMTVSIVGAAVLAQGSAWAAADAKSRQAALAADAKVVAAAAAKVPNRALVVQTPAPINLPPMTAEQIVQRNVAARGGLAAWERVSAMSMQGKLDVGKVRPDGGNVGLTKQEAKALVLRAAASPAESAKASQIIQLPFALDLQRPNKMRLEIPFRGETATQVFDGAQGWKLRPFLGRHEVEPYSADELKIASSELPLDGSLINHAAKGIKVAMDGAEVVDGRNAYRLKLTLRDGAQRRVWVDAETMLELRIEGAPRRFDGRMHAVSTHFSDYRQVEGLLIPYRMQTVVDGERGTQGIYIEKVALNPAFDGARFARPQ